MRLGKGRTELRGEGSPKKGVGQGAHVLPPSPITSGLCVHF